MAKFVLGLTIHVDERDDEVRRALRTFGETVAKHSHAVYAERGEWTRDRPAMIAAVNQLLAYATGVDVASASRGGGGTFFDDDDDRVPVDVLLAQLDGVEPLDVGGLMVAGEVDGYDDDYWQS